MFEREDWTLFRTVEGLQQRAGVSAERLRRLVLKELADNGLDTGGSITVDQIDADHFVIEDDGPGIDGTPEDVAALFSIKRPMRSAKLLRKPQRGALGNGLRVVAGAVLASAGSLTVTTRNQRIELQPKSEGSTAVVKVSKVEHPVGTRVEIGFGPALPPDRNALSWAENAQKLAGVGDDYKGLTSAYWYDAAQFHELLLACGAQPVRSLVVQFDGCSGGTAGKIVAAAGLSRIDCEAVSRDQAIKLLNEVRERSWPVNPNRLGCLGRNAFPGHWYVIERATVAIGGSEPQAQIPFVVEVWATKRSHKGEVNGIFVNINRTPSTSEMRCYRTDDKELSVFGSGLAYGCRTAPKKGSYAIIVNVTTPYCPITSDGKAPDLDPFSDRIMDAIGSATRKAQRAAPEERKVSQKSIVLDNLDAVIAIVSGPKRSRFNSRQILYRMRKIVKDLLGEDKELTTDNFQKIITNHENEHGEIPRMYREPRGSVYHPHRKETIALGTLMVEEYERPAWLYNKVVYIEKEGFGEALKDDDWPERHDCMPMSSKGYTTRAARDLVDVLAKHAEPVTVFCVHDADAPGTMIHQTFQEATKARKARTITITNLGLEPWEAIAMGLEAEKLPASDDYRPVADYVRERDANFPNEGPGGISWERWLQRHRVELNAMTTPQFIAWLDAKMAEHGAGKLIPPEDVIKAELEVKLKAKVTNAVTERILREANAEHQIKETLASIKRPSGASLFRDIKAMFEREPEKEWRALIDTEVAKARNG